MEPEVIEVCDTATSKTLIFIGARAGYRPSKEEATAITNRTTNKRGDPMLWYCPIGFDWLTDADVDWFLRDCSGPLILLAYRAERLLAIRTEWSRK